MPREPQRHPQRQASPFLTRLGGVKDKVQLCSRTLIVGSKERRLLQFAADQNQRVARIDPIQRLFVNCAKIDIKRAG